MSNEMTRNGETREAVEARRVPETPVFAPAVDVREDGEAFTVLCSLPGVEPGDVDLRCEQGRLEIRAKATSRQPESTPYLLREYSVGAYERSFNLTDTVDASRISAELDNGVLTLTLPKVEAVRPRRIEVRGK